VFTRYGTRAASSIDLCARPTKFIVTVTARLPVIIIYISVTTRLFMTVGYKVYLSCDGVSRADPSCRLPLLVASAAPGTSAVTRKR